MKYNNYVAQPEKIALIHNMLNDTVVGDYYNRWLKLAFEHNTFKKREEAFHAYAKARDLYLGLKPLVLPMINPQTLRRTV